MKKMRRLLSILLTLLMALSLLAGCGGEKPAEEAGKPDAPEQSEPAAESDAVKIMVFTSISGDNAAAGAMDVAGARLAVKHINEDGGVLGGKKVELVEVDATSDSTQAPLILEKALASGGISAIVGSHTSSIVLTQLPILEQYQVPCMGGPANMTICTQGYNYFFRGGPHGEDLRDANLGMLKYLVELSGKTMEEFNVGIIFENSSYGNDTAGDYGKYCEELGFNVKVNESWAPYTLTDASALVTKLKQNNVDLVLSVAFPADTKLIMNTMDTMDYNPYIVGGGAGFIWPTLYDEMGSDVNGIISAAAWNWDSTCNSEIEGWQDIVDDYEATNGVFMAEQAGQTYSFVRVLADAIDKAGTSDSKAVRDTLAGMTAEDSQWMKLIAPGKGGFDSTGEHDSAVGTVIQWQNDIPTTVYPLEIAASDLLIE